MSSRDLCFGRRFHGCIIGMQAGMPALMIAVDDRMREMLEFVGFPYIEAATWNREADKTAYLPNFLSKIDTQAVIDRYSACEANFRNALQPDWTLEDESGGAARASACALPALWAFAPAPPATQTMRSPLASAINRVNLAWLSRADQESVLRGIAASGITHVRLSLSRPVDKSIEALEIADRLGLKILLEIQLGNKDYYPPETARPRTGFGRIWDVHRLSDLDLDLYRTQLALGASPH